MKAQGFKRMKCLVIEDEPLAAEALCALIAEEGGSVFEIVGVAANAAEARRMLEKHCPDVVFADIRLPGRSGLEIAKTLADDTAIVFATAYDEYALAAFELGAVDYLLKPYEPGRIRIALQRLKRNRGHALSGGVNRRLEDVAASGALLERVYVSHGGSITPVQLRMVMRIEAKDGYACLSSEDGGEHLLSVSLNYLEPRLRALDFVRINRSCLANMHYVEKFQAHADRRLRARFSDGAERVASRAFSQRFRARARGGGRASSQ